eukprot:3239297-Pyramimonas_sp.AAC.1
MCIRTSTSLGDIQGGASARPAAASVAFSRGSLRISRARSVTCWASGGASSSTQSLAAARWSGRHWRSSGTSAG